MALAFNRTPVVVAGTEEEILALGALPPIGTVLAASDTNALYTVESDGTGGTRLVRSGFSPVTGTATLVNGTVSVTPVAVTANSVIFLTHSTLAGTAVGVLCERTASRVAGPAGTIVLDSRTAAAALADDDSDIYYMIVEPSGA